LPIPTLTSDDESRLSELQARLVRRVYEQWEQFELPMSYGPIAGAYNRACKKQGMTVQTLVDTVVQMGYIQRIPTKRGGVVLLPSGIWDQLPVYKQESWRNPSKAKTERERELDMGRKIRLLKSERDVPLRDALGYPIQPPQAAPTPEPNPPQQIGQPDLKDTVRGILKGSRTSSGLDSLQKGAKSDSDEPVRRQPGAYPGGSAGKPDQRGHE
jgi:hypothetical protein